MCEPNFPKKQKFTRDFFDINYDEIMFNFFDGLTIIAYIKIYFEKN